MATVDELVERYCLEGKSESVGLHSCPNQHIYDEYIIAEISITNDGDATISGEVERVGFSLSIKFVYCPFCGEPLGNSA